MLLVGIPYAFTEQDIYMLMTVLRELAVKQSKALIRLSKFMKDTILNNTGDN